jgi:hypothetical protein
MQQYFIGQRFDFPRWLNDMGIPYGNQHRFIAQITGQPEHVVRGWGNGFENLPENCQGFIWGYFKGFAEAQAQAQAHAYNESQAVMHMEAMAFQSYLYSSAQNQAIMLQNAAGRF